MGSSRCLDTVRVFLLTRFPIPGASRGEIRAVITYLFRYIVRERVKFVVLLSLAVADCPIRTRPFLHFRTFVLFRSRRTLARSKVYDVLRDISRSRVVPFNGDPLLVRHVGTYLPNAYPLPARARRNPDTLGATFARERGKIMSGLASHFE